MWSQIGEVRGRLVFSFRLVRVGIESKCNDSETNDLGSLESLVASELRSREAMVMLCYILSFIFLLFKA